MSKTCKDCSHFAAWSHSTEDCPAGYCDKVREAFFVGIRCLAYCYGGSVDTFEIEEPAEFSCAFHTPHPDEGGE